MTIPSRDVPIIPNDRYYTHNPNNLTAKGVLQHNFTQDYGFLGDRNCSYPNYPSFSSFQTSPQQPRPLQYPKDYTRIPPTPQVQEMSSFASSNKKNGFKSMMKRSF